MNEKVEAIEDNDVVLLEDTDGKLSLGLLGVINGMLGPGHRISGVYDDDGQLQSFRAFGS